MQWHYLAGSDEFTHLGHMKNINHFISFSARLTNNQIQQDGRPVETTLCLLVTMMLPFMTQVINIYFYLHFYKTYNYYNY